MNLYRKPPLLYCPIVLDIEQHTGGVETQYCSYTLPCAEHPWTSQLKLFNNGEQVYNWNGPHPTTR